MFPASIKSNKDAGSGLLPETKQAAEATQQQEQYQNHPETPTPG